MPKVLLIGWDGAGWNKIHPLLDSGAMPNLARMIENGVMGDLNTLTPLCPPLLWTSVATGTYADRHGILDTLEPDPVTGGVRPATRASLGAPQIWDTLAQEGLRCQTIGWPVTHPAKGPASCVSDGFTFGVPDSVYPKALESKLLPLRFHPQEWTGTELHLFVPEMARIDQDKDKRLAKLAVVLAEAVSVHAAATTLLESAEWDFSAIWFGVLGRACELFPGSTDEIYKDVISGVYRFLDLLLGRLLNLAGPEAVVMLVSDRTAGEHELRSMTGREPRGLLCASGPHIEADELAFGAGLLDIAPTILALFGFAPAPGMSGRTITEICCTAPARTVQNLVFTPPPENSPDLDLLELEASGYTDSIAAGWRREAEAAKNRRDFHLARVFMAQDRLAEAISLLEQLAAHDAAVLEIRFHLAHAYFRNGQYRECRELCEALLVDAPDSSFEAVARAHLAIAEGNYEEALAHLRGGQADFGMIAGLDTVVGDAYLRIGKWDEAAAAFRSAIQKDARIAAAHEGLAQALLEQGQSSEAAEAALDAIRLRYDQPAAHEILGQALQAMGRIPEAAGAFANSEMLRERQPVA
jgi:predicted AlkP superfamily phosphohydrolase/phosphomutase/Tfp pilus assembly protein PilF